MIPELVVLVDENNTVLGTMPKSEVHGAETPLHRAFSIFLFNAEKKLLLQQRSHVKKTWPLAWSNSCCGHP
jgi:isopentenyl-diphosphate delta-isomerase